MYIEYYIIENLLINYIIISCTSILIKRHTNEKKKMDRCFFRNYILSCISISYFRRIIYIAI